MNALKFSLLVSSLSKARLSPHAQNSLEREFFLGGGGGGLLLRLWLRLWLMTESFSSLAISWGWWWREGYVKFCGFVWMGTVMTSKVLPKKAFSDYYYVSRPANFYLF